MKLRISLMIAFAIIFSGSVVSSSSQRPFVLRDQQGEIDYCKNEPSLSPCFGRRMEIKNPRREAVWVYLNCGEGFFSSPDFSIPGKQSVIINIQSDIPGSLKANACKIDHWRIYR